MKQDTIAVLIPCYNEHKTIQKVVKDFKGQLPQARIYVFDNNSTDCSGELAEKAGAKVIKEKRQGKGFVVSSMLFKIKADYYIIVDGDDTYPAEYVHELLKPLIDEKADMVVGQRLNQYEQQAFRKFHVFGNKLICLLLNSIFHTELTDPLSGYRAFTYNVARQLPVVAIGFDIETEFSLQMLYRHLVIKEVSIPYRARPAGSESKLATFKDGISILFKIFSILRSYRPLTFFGIITIVCEILAFGFGGYIINSMINGETLNLALIILASSLFTIGIITMSTGLIISSINFRLLENMSVLEKQIYWMDENKRK